MKAQVLANFLANHPCLDMAEIVEQNLNIFSVDKVQWAFWFDNSSTKMSAGVGIIITSLAGTKMAISFNLEIQCTNNQAKYEALIIGLEIFRELEAKEYISWEIHNWSPIS